MDKYADELKHLKGSQIFLPPNFESNGSQKVVGVHDHMDETIECAAKTFMSARQPSDQHPILDWHDSMMDQL